MHGGVKESQSEMTTLTTVSFDPAIDAMGFRRALGSFATGVTVVTTVTDDGPMAIVANSFASVSLDPPLVLWSPAKNTARFHLFADARRYAINVLSASQRDVCSAVLGARTALSEIPHRLGENGCPIIADALASFECHRVTAHDAGDHIIVVGEVSKAQHRPGDPLVFHGGSYGAFHSD